MCGNFKFCGMEGGAEGEKKIELPNIQNGAWSVIKILLMTIIILPGSMKKALKNEYYYIIMLIASYTSFVCISIQ